MSVSPSARRRSDAPVVDIDLYADDVLADSREAFARIRDAGALVWLPRHRMYAMGRFADVRAALRDDTGFRSGRGVAANPMTNVFGKGTTLISDDDVHSRRRRVLMHSLGAKAIAGVEEPLRREADRLIDDLARRRHFDGARDFATHLPVSVVSGLVGIKIGSAQMLRWAASTFDALGPPNRRMLRAGPRSLGLLRYAFGLRAHRVAPGSWAASVFQAEARGDLTHQEAKTLVIDLVVPSLDTTILASTHLLWTLGRHPEAWDELRGDPSLITSAVMESVRLSSPIRGFTRWMGGDREIEGITLPQGARVALLFGAANLDERQFPEPGHFDLHRPSNVHVGWGNGPHACVGMHLAKLELRVLLEAMVARVDRILVGRPSPFLNNTLQGIAALPARFR